MRDFLRFSKFHEIFGIMFSGENYADLHMPGDHLTITS